MPREQFLYEGTKELCDLIDRAGNKAGFGRGQAFEDFLTLTVCTLATGLMEDEYLATVRKGYDKGEKGSRGIDFITQAFGRLVLLMEDNRDYLGDLFCGGISFGQRGEFFTSQSLTTLMAELTIDDEATGETVCDPCCGSGRMLLASLLPDRPVGKRHSRRSGNRRVL
jgi:type I restriction enzyme M protein